MGLAVSWAASAYAGDRTEPPPPSGMYRLIRIGPQALVLEDEHGSVTMVDEPAPRVKRGTALGAFLGLWVGAVAGQYLAGVDDFGEVDVLRGAVIGGSAGASAAEDAAPRTRPSHKAVPHRGRYDLVDAANVGAAPR
jgi:hypothetical protein